MESLSAAEKFASALTLQETQKKLIANQSMNGALNLLQQKKYPEAIQSKPLELEENFADGRNPQDKGDSKRHGVPTKSSVSNLRKFAKSHSGRAAQLAHWMANMKAGKKKK